jgi:hypothetical protein
MLSARAPCSQVCLGLRQASRQLSNARYRHQCAALPKGGSSRNLAARHAVGQHNRRVTLTTLLGSTVLAMGFGTSAMAASATSPTVETVHRTWNATPDIWSVCMCIQPCYAKVCPESALPCYPADLAEPKLPRDISFWA